MKNNEDVLKVLAESNYWKRFCLIEILAISNKPVIQLLKEDMFAAQHLLNYDELRHFHILIVIVSIFRYFYFIVFYLLCFNFVLLFSIVIGNIFHYLNVLISSYDIIKM